MEKEISSNKEKIQQQLTFIQLETAVENIDRATSTLIESTVSIFLPFKNVRMTNIHDEFLANNQVIELGNKYFKKVEIRGRLLGQGHKDILEVLLGMDKEYYEDTKSFGITTTTNEITKKLGRNRGKKKWLLEKIKEISQCRLDLYFVGKDGKDKNFEFGFIDSNFIENYDNNDAKITIDFTRAYTHFLAKTELLDYSNFIDDILGISKLCTSIDNEERKKISYKNLTKEDAKKKKIKRATNSEFIKAMVRYMLQHNGQNSRRTINQIIEDLSLTRIMGRTELYNSLADLKKEKIQNYLQEKFGIFLESDFTTVNFDIPEDKTRYYLQASLFD